MIIDGVNDVGHLEPRWSPSPELRMTRGRAVGRRSRASVRRPHRCSSRGGGARCRPAPAGPSSGCVCAAARWRACSFAPSAPPARPTCLAAQCRPPCIDRSAGRMGAARRRCRRLAIEPEVGPTFKSGIESAGFVPAKPTQPQHTRILDLRPPDELLAGFRKGRRYNIRAGERRGVVVEEGKDAAELARQSAAVERREIDPSARPALLPAATRASALVPHLRRL